MGSGGIKPSLSLVINNQTIYKQMAQKVIITSEEIREVGRVRLPKDAKLYLDMFGGLHVGTETKESMEVTEKRMNEALKDLHTPISSVDLVTTKRKDYNVWVIHTIEKKSFVVENFADAAIAIHQIFK